MANATSAFNSQLVAKRRGPKFISSLDHQKKPCLFFFFFFFFCFFHWPNNSPFNSRRPETVSGSSKRGSLSLLGVQIMSSLAPATSCRHLNDYDCVHQPAKLHHPQTVSDCLPMGQLVLLSPTRSLDLSIYPSLRLSVCLAALATPKQRPSNEAEGAPKLSLPFRAG